MKAFSFLHHSRKSTNQSQKHNIDKQDPKQNGKPKRSLQIDSSFRRSNKKPLSDDQFPPVQGELDSYEPSRSSNDKDSTISRFSQEAQTLFDKQPQTRVKVPIYSMFGFNKSSTQVSPSEETSAGSGKGSRKITSPPVPRRPPPAPPLNLDIPAPGAPKLPVYAHPIPSLKGQTSSQLLQRRRAKTVGESDGRAPHLSIVPPLPSPTLSLRTPITPTSLASPGFLSHVPSRSNIPVPTSRSRSESSASSSSSRTSKKAHFESLWDDFLKEADESMQALCRDFSLEGCLNQDGVVDVAYKPAQRSRGNTIPSGRTMISLPLTPVSPFELTIQTVLSPESLVDEREECSIREEQIYAKKVTGFLDKEKPGTDQLPPSNSNGTLSSLPYLRSPNLFSPSPEVCSQEMLTQISELNSPVMGLCSPAMASSVALDDCPEEIDFFPQKSPSSGSISLVGTPTSRPCSEFSLSCFPSPPSVTLGHRPLTEKGTFRVQPVSNRATRTGLGFEFKPITTRLDKSSDQKTTDNLPTGNSDITISALSLNSIPVSSSAGSINVSYGYHATYAI